MRANALVEALKNCSIHGTLQDLYIAGQVLAADGIKTTIHEDDIAGYWIDIDVKKTMETIKSEYDTCPF